MGELVEFSFLYFQKRYTKHPSTFPCQRGGDIARTSLRTQMEKQRKHTFHMTHLDDMEEFGSNRIEEREPRFKIILLE